AFGVAFICARLASPNALSRFGGYRVVTLCMAVQTLGLLLVWLAPSPLVAILGAALTGLGVSWVYPGLAGETLARTPGTRRRWALYALGASLRDPGIAGQTRPRTPQPNRNSALSTLSLSFALAVGLAGPLVGLVAFSLGLPWIFYCSALMSAIGFPLVTPLRG